MSSGASKLKMGLALILKLNLTLKVKVDCPQNNRDPNQVILHLWSKFCDPTLSGSQVYPIVHARYGTRDAVNLNDADNKSGYRHLLHTHRINATQNKFLWGLHRIAQTLCIYHIRVSSRDPHGSSKHPQRHCSFNSLFKLAKKKTTKLHIAVTLCEHDDVIKWKHFPRYWPFVRGIHRSPVNSPHKGQWRGALMFTLICARINGWVNNREAGDLRRNRAHYDVIVMGIPSVTGWFPLQRPVMRNRVSVISSSWQIVIDQSHKSLNAPVPYPQCTILKIYVTK